MLIERLCANHFRNLVDLQLTPHPQVNIIYGDNAQGKTNLLEAIWMFTGSHSFRGAKEAELIELGEAFSRLEANFFSAGRSQTAQITLGESKNARLNGVSLSSASKLTGHFFVVVFSPVHLSLVKDGPGGRRRFLDQAISQLRPRFVAALGQYQRILTQRNTLLKTIQRHPSLGDTLDTWDQALAKQGAVLIKTRRQYLKLLEQQAIEIYQGISGGRENLSLHYEGTIAPMDDAEGFAAFLKTQRQQDIALGYTQSGPHRDDLSIWIDGRSARLYGSQGQQRSAVLALKLAECALIEQLMQEAPVVLLDDVMSELDASRRDFLLNRMQGRQVFITCCDRAVLSGAQQGRIYRMEGGQLISSQPVI